MSTASEAEVRAALAKVIDPEVSQDIVSMGMVKNLKVKDGRVSFTLELTTPACPSGLYCFGPSKDFYVCGSAPAHDVEAGGHHLLNHGLLSPSDPDANWAIDYMEDVWFFLHPSVAGYEPDVMREDWFTYGGFSKIQPYYTRNAQVYALRDDVKPFIRSYFNTLASTLSRETLALFEHFRFHGEGHWPNWNKTHETGWFLEQTRLMLVMERGDELWLAPFVTNHWMKDGMVVGVTNAPTRFGKVSYTIRSKVNEGYIEASIRPPARTLPAKVVVRLRHPEGHRIQRVTVSGRLHKDFDSAREIVRVKPGRRSVTVRAYYGRPGAQRPGAGPQSPTLA